MILRAEAKINLTLEVLGKRADGYHALRSFVVPISLADELEVEATRDGTFTSDTGFADDLCVKAARALSAAAQADAVRDVGLRAHTDQRGARIRVKKFIPVGGGLGGGSADAAATLRALNEIWELGKSPEELARIGAQVGSDVPALVLAQHYHCPVLMEGRGEIVTPLLPPPSSLGLLPHPSFLPKRHLVLVNPGVPSSTKDVYALCRPRAGVCPPSDAGVCPSSDAGVCPPSDAGVCPPSDAGVCPPSDAGVCPSPTEALMKVWATATNEELANYFVNDLEEPAVTLCPQIGEALRRLAAAGATGVMMSGSGSSIFGFVADAPTASRLAASLSAEGLHAYPLSC